MIKKDNIIVKSLSYNEIGEKKEKSIVDEIEQKKLLLKKRLEAPILKFPIGEKKNLIVVDEGMDTVAIAFHYLFVTDKWGIKVMCGGEGGHCLLCALQKKYPDKIRPAYYYSCFTVIDLADKKLKVMTIPYKHLQNIFVLAYNTPEFLKNASISITKTDNYTYQTSIELQGKNQITRYKIKTPVTPFDYFQYFQPLTAGEIEQLGFDLSGIQKTSHTMLSTQQNQNEGFYEIDVLVADEEKEQESEKTKIDNIINETIENDDDEIDIMEFVDDGEMDGIDEDKVI